MYIIIIINIEWFLFQKVRPDVAELADKVDLNQPTGMNSDSSSSASSSSSSSSGSDSGSEAESQGPNRKRCVRGPSGLS